MLPNRATHHILSILLKLFARKVGALTLSMKFLSFELTLYLYKPTI